MPEADIVSQLMGHNDGLYNLSFLGTDCYTQNWFGVIAENGSVINLHLALNWTIDADQIQVFRINPGSQSVLLSEL